MAKTVLVALTAAAPLALVGCDSSDSPHLPIDPPTTITKVATGGFTAPTDAVASPDGKMFYFAARDEMNEPAIFRTSSEPGSTPEVLATGAPLEMPIGLVMSCDGATLYIADLGSDLGAVRALPTALGGAVSDLGATGMVRPGGLAMAKDCKTLYATGLTDAGQPALFSMAAAGGAASVVYQGEPLVAPSGLHIDDDYVAWVMDNRAHGDTGEGVLFAIPRDGSAANQVASGLRMGTPGGVSLTAGGGTAVMPTRDADGNAQLTSVSIKTGEPVQLSAPGMIDPAGLRTARGAGVFAVVDSEGGAIYRAE
jgi:DNA-binding beta-propeller fold protein YncE